MSLPLAKKAYGYIVPIGVVLVKKRRFFAAGQGLFDVGVPCPRLRGHDAAARGIFVLSHAWPRERGPCHPHLYMWFSAL